MSPDDIGKITFQKTNNDGFAFYASTEFWLGKAAELHMAAQTLADSSFSLVANREMYFRESMAVVNIPQCITPFPPDPRIGAGVWQTMMIAGFALEAVFKALVIKAKPEVVKGGKLNNFNHDLVSFANWANLGLSDLEIRLCEICMHATVCAGRYPTSKNANDLAIEWRVDLQLAWPIYQSLYAKCYHDAIHK